MRSPAVIVPAIVLLAGAVYFFAKAGDKGARLAGGWRYDQSAPAPAGELADDEYDEALVRELLKSTDPSEGEANSLLSAAGRRYMRRKFAYAAAKQAVDTGKAA